MKISSLLTAFALATAASVSATSVTVGELGNLRPSAFDLDSYFSTPAPATVFGSSPTASVDSSINAYGDVDWYSFSGWAGAALNVDVDTAGLGSPVNDSLIAIFRADGTLLAYNDDSYLEAGSTSTLDSFIGTLFLPASETYYLAVTTYANFPDAAYTAGGFAGLTRPDALWGGDLVLGATPGDDTFDDAGTDYYESGDYLVHLSLGEGQAPVPEPSTWMAAAALTGLVLRRMRRA